jgi:membrane protease YdiL (CAAX protease family)
MTIDRGIDGTGFALRRTALFFGYLFCALSIAAVLSYPLVQTGWLDYEPQRIMGRLAQLIILLGLWPFLRWLALADRRSLGFAPPRAEILQTIKVGWLFGVLTLLALVTVELILEIRVPEDDWSSELPSLLSKALAALIGGLLIGLGEEMFFRGALYTSIRRGAGVAAAAGFSALLYAMVHFMKPHALPDGMVFDGFGVWTMFAGVFVGLFQWQHLDSLAALLAAGVLLALLRERSGHIGWCIGVHAGWVFVIQLTRRVTDGNEASGLAFLVGGYDGVIGWLGAAWITLLAVVYWWMTKPSHGPSSQ